MQVWLGRFLTAVMLLLLSVSGTIFLAQGALPRLWRDFKCLPSYAQQQSLPYATFVLWVKAGRIRSILFSAAQAQAYVQDPTGSYRVKLPELDLSWQELLSKYNVRIVELVADSC